METDNNNPQVNKIISICNACKKNMLCWKSDNMVKSNQFIESKLSTYVQCENQYFSTFDNHYSFLKKKKV